jgi:hypothetical protein
MKACKGVFVLFVLSFSLLTCFDVSSVDASTYHGKFCWDFSGGVEQRILELGVTELSQGQYLLTGKTLENGVLRHVVNGNAVIEGNNARVTLTGSDKDDLEVNTFISHGIFDLSTLNGTWSFSSTETETLNYVTCP